MPVKERDSRESGRGSGTSSPASFASFDPDSCSWRTSQRCLIEGWATFSGPWPRSGMTRNGTAFRRRPLVPRITEIGCFYLPTPEATAGAFSGNPTMHVEVCRRQMTTGKRKSGAQIGTSLLWCPEFIREHLRTGGELSPEWPEALMGFPIGWSDLKASATPSSPKSPSGSGGD